MPRSHRPSLVLACLLAALGACTSEPPPKTYDPEEIIAEAVEFEAALERLDLEAVASVHGTKDGFGEIYANEAAAAVFREIDGGDPSATAEFPRGAILVKNNLDAHGDPLGELTILAKFEAGYSAETRDWFFAVVDPEGKVLDDRIGSGPEVYYCYDCHSQLGSDTDLVIGLLPEQLR